MEILEINSMDRNLIGDHLLTPEEFEKVIEWAGNTWDGYRNKRKEIEAGGGDKAKNLEVFESQHLAAQVLIYYLNGKHPAEEVLKLPKYQVEKDRTVYMQTWAWAKKYSIRSAANEFGIDRTTVRNRVKVIEDQADRRRKHKCDGFDLEEHDKEVNRLCPGGIKYSFMDNLIDDWVGSYLREKNKGGEK
jgi:hypothetical protein